MSKIKIARALAPEDISRGMHVAILHINVEYVPSVCIDELRPKAPPVFCLRLLPLGGGEPMQVLEVCLPFILVRQGDGDTSALDVRRYQLAQVSERYAQRAAGRPRKRKRR